MLQLLQPIWMFTATAMAVPLLIHLWNVRSGKRLKVGSLELLSTTIQKTARRIRITEWLLLLLRCLLIFLLAVMLSRPVWNKTAAASGKGWVMIPRESLQPVYQHFQSQVDSLIAAGYSFHYFNYPFENGAVNGKSAGTADADYWRRVAQLDNILPAGWPVYLYTPGNISQFGDIKPVIDIDLHWQTMPLRDTTTANNASDTTALHITIYADQYKQDAPYIAAAMEALRPVFGREIVIHETSDANLPQGQDWIFWLSDKQPSQKQAGAVYFRYASGDIVPVNSSLQTVNEHHAAQESINLYKKIKHGTPNKAVWTDGYGDVILDYAIQKQEYTLYTHFNPSWNNLVWSADFPLQLFALMQDGKAGGADNRQVDTAQLSFIPGKDIAKKNGGTQVPLGMYVWGLVLLVFIAERWLSHSSKTRNHAA